MQDDVKNDLKGFFKNYKVYVYFIIGSLLIICGYVFKYATTLPDYVYSAFLTVGTTIISSGVVTSILQSDHFQKIFQNAIRQILFYDEKYLAKQVDLENIWDSISRQLSKRKFESISDKIQSNIKNYFLPIKQDFYYDNLSIKLEIERDKNNPEYALVKETHRGTIITDSDGEITYTFENGIPFDLNDRAQTYYHLDSLQINNKECKDSPNCLSVEDRIDVNWNVFTYKCKGKERYDFVRREHKRYKLSLNNTKRQLAAWLYNGCKLEILYSDDLEIDFYDLGVLKEWFYTKEITINKVNRIEARYNDLIYMNQGFLLNLKPI